MKPKNRNSTLFLSALAVLGIIFLVGVLFLLNSAKTVRLTGPTESTQPTRVGATVTSTLNVLLEKIPVAYTTPLPDPIQSPLDGIYTKVDPSWPQWWLCRRCADYRSAGGIWKLEFNRGVMSIYYEVTGWMSVASFTASGDRLHIFNDPYCPEDVGEFTWKLEARQLTLEIVDDLCSFDLRGKNLSNQPWTSCLPPDKTTRDNNLWQKPSGCEENPAIPSIASPTNLHVNIDVHGGDSRFFEKPPEIIAHANSADGSSPEGIRVTYHSDSIPFGLNRVLWWKGDWIQASTELSFDSMGVQFLGDPPIGWARVLFDRVEVWRGNTSAIWSERGRHGGYIEISGFSPGMHTIRVETLGFDYHPVTVASFGFNYHDGVASEKP
ncbi:hypothetical protein ACFLV7_09540 [Chloroflexota bacterium]